MHLVVEVFLSVQKHLARLGLESSRSPMMSVNESCLMLAQEQNDPSSEIFMRRFGQPVKAALIVSHNFTGA